MKPSEESSNKHNWNFMSTFLYIYILKECGKNEEQSFHCGFYCQVTKFLTIFGTTVMLIEKRHIL